LSHPVCLGAFEGDNIAFFEEVVTLATAHAKTAGSYADQKYSTLELSDGLLRLMLRKSYVQAAKSRRQKTRREADGAEVVHDAKVCTPLVAVRLASDVCNACVFRTGEGAASVGTYAAKRTVEKGTFQGRCSPPPLGGGSNRGAFALPDELHA
jgi:ribosomal protein L32